MPSTSLGDAKNCCNALEDVSAPVSPTHGWADCPSPSPVCSERADPRRRVGPGVNPVELEIVRELDRFLHLELSWNLLLGQSRHDELFLRHEWLRCWWKAFGKSSKLFVHVLRDGGNLLGAAPLMIRFGMYRGLPARVVSFMENHNTFRSDFLYAPGNDAFVDLVVRFLLQHRAEWDLVELNNIPDDSPTCERLLMATKKHGLFCHARPGLRSPFIEFEKCWSDYIASKSRKIKKTMNNWRNRLSRRGNTEFEEVRDFGDPDRRLDRLFQISEVSWKGAHGRSMGGDRKNRLFFRLLNRVAVERKWLHIWLLRLDGRPVAFEYHLRYNGTELGLRSDFDENLRDVSPGSNLDAYIVQRLFEEKIHKYDMGGGCDPYKVRWTDNCRRHTCFLIFGSHMYARLLQCMDVCVAEYFKRFPRMVQLVKHVRRIASGFNRLTPGNQ